MAPNLAASQHDQIRDMILSRSLRIAQMANTAGCSTRSVKAIRSNLRYFGTAKAPANGVGRPRSITPPMLEALREYLLGKPDRYLDELAILLCDDFDVLVTTMSISRALASMDLRDFYLHNMSAFRSYHLVFVDESGCDMRIGFRRTAWSPVGVTPVQIAQFHRSKRYQILPAYTQDGVILARVFQGSTDSIVFEDFIEQLLPLCGRWPEPKSVLVMDNASFHHSERTEQLCDEAGVKLVYLPPYSPDFNPIEEFFAELKAFIKKSWHNYEEDPEQGFGAFLEWCIDIVGGRERSARGHFRHAGLTVEEL
ncbi:hypothetical protein LSUE1_G004474 [Lachnellula suecica]|uniref:Tc1-like transposase DDE domain-containing protein n=1 Tax=Lachnellula suecica TaxID=602035 RepID=A0A8T9C3Z2_9HELO|nr:hypothetical protein LSUE1_G004474 [Lachnellula suecica]